MYAYIQRELDLFNKINEVNQAPVWDEGSLFVAFIRGEDVHGRLQNKKKTSGQNQRIK